MIFQKYEKIKNLIFKKSKLISIKKIKYYNIIKKNKVEPSIINVKPTIKDIIPNDVNTNVNSVNNLE